MFISRKESLERLNHPDNPFSPTKRGSDNWGRVVEVVHDTSHNDPTVPSSTPVAADIQSEDRPEEADTTSPAFDGKSAPESNPSPNEIRDILKQVNPAVARDRTTSL